MRLLDLLSSTLGLILLFPFFLLIALLIKFTSSGPVFYRGLRVGKDGKLFHLFKFRTMVTDADRHGPGITTVGDPRITPIGAWLRRYKLDELPQLINVLNGDMSLVGPRPEDPRYVTQYTAEQKEVLKFRPGITSAASLTYRHEEEILSGADLETVYRIKILPSKISIDLAYLSKRTLISDLFLIVRTILSLFQ